MSTFKDTLDQIKERGGYYLEFRPNVFKKDQISSLRDLKKNIREAKVSLRGWPFPLVPQENKDFAKMYNSGDKIEAWVATDHYREVWRFYMSGLFVNYSAFRVDWYKESSFVKGSPLTNIEPKTILDPIDVIYDVTEMILFTGRIADDIEDIEEFNLRFVLLNVKGRKLVVLDQARASLSLDYICENETIEFEKVFSRKQLTTTPTQISKEIIMWIFEQFNWDSVSIKLIEDEQNKLLNRTI